MNQKKIYVLVLLVVIVILLIKKIPKILKWVLVVAVVIYFVMTVQIDYVKHEKYMMRVSDLQEILRDAYYDFYHLDGYLYNEEKILMSETQAICACEEEDGYYIAMEERHLLRAKYRLEIHVIAHDPRNDLKDVFQNIVLTPEQHAVEIGNLFDEKMYVFNYKAYYVWIEARLDSDFIRDEQFEKAILAMIDDFYQVNEER